MATVKKPTRVTRQTKKKVVPKKPLPSKAEMVVKYVQFSKRMTAFILIFWAVYRSAQLVVGVIEPSISEALVKLSSGIDTVAIAFGLAYSANSVCEKYLNVQKEIQKMMYVNVDDDSSKDDSSDKSSEEETEEENDNG